MGKRELAPKRLVICRKLAVEMRTYRALKRRLGGKARGEVGGGGGEVVYPHPAGTWHICI